MTKSKPQGYPRQINDGYEVLPLDAIKPHPRNPRRGDLDAIKASVDVNGFYGAIVANKRTGYILAGNHRYLAAKMLGLAEVPVVWVDVGDAEEKRILAADNRTGDLGGYDDAVLASLLQGLQDDGGLLGTGYDEDDLSGLIDELQGDLLDGDGDASPYTHKIESPIYEPKGERPDLTELFDTSRADELIKAIEASDLEEPVKRFLRLAAHRHVVFRYDHIAEYYAHADAELQRHMESSALVIIDFDDAIEKGFVKMTKRLQEVYHDEYE